MLALAIFAAACGGDDGADSESGAQSDPGNEATTGLTPEDSNEEPGEDGADPENTGDDDSDQQGSDAPDEQSGDDLATAGQSVAAFTACMSERGVELPELTLDASGNLVVGELLTSLDTNDPATQSALFGCQGQLDDAVGGQLTELLESQTVEEALALFSQCVRDGGYDVADLTLPGLIAGALGGDLGEDPRGETGSIDPFLAAALKLDPQDVEVLNTVDGCATIVEQNLNDLGLG